MKKLIHFIGWRSFRVSPLLGFILLLLFAASGCATPDLNQTKALDANNEVTLKILSSGQVGCAPAKVTIKDFNQAFTAPAYWTAVCNDKNYHCVRENSGDRWVTNCAAESK